MKKSIYILLMIAMFFSLSQTSLAQQDSMKTTMTHEDYFKKSKRQKTAAWIFTGVGVAVTIVSLADAVSSVSDYNSSEDENDGTVTSVISVASIATGVYFFIASGKNKRKARAASVFIDIEKIPVLQQTVIRKNSYPAIGVRLGL